MYIHFAVTLFFKYDMLILLYSTAPFVGMVVFCRFAYIATNVHSVELVSPYHLIRPITLFVPLVSTIPAMKLVFLAAINLM